MAKRVVLAYSGGLDTSVAVHWLRAELGYEVIAVAVDVGQGGDLDSVRERALAAGAVEARRDRRPRGARRATSSLPALQANALYEGRYPLVSALSRPLIVRHLVAEARAPRRRRRRPRLHRQGQRPGPLRGRHPRPRPRPRDRRPGPRVGHDPRGDDRLRRASTASRSRRARTGSTRSTRTSGDGRSSAACIEDPWEAPPEDVFTLTDGPTASRSRWYGRLRGRACRSASTAGRSPLVELIGRARRDRRRVRVRPRRHRREPPRRDQEPRGLRVPGCARADPAHQDLEGLTLERDVAHEKLRLEPRFAELVYDGMWFSPLREALGAFVADDPAPRHGRGAAALLAGRRSARRRAAQPGRPLRLRARDLRRRGHASATRTRRASSASRPRRSRPGRAARAAPPARRRGRDALARAGWPRRRRRGMMAFTASLAFDRASPPTTCAARRRTCAASARAGILTAEEAAVLLAALERVGEELATGELRLRGERRGHPHGDRAPRHRDRRRRRGQAAHRPEPQRPGRDGAAALHAPRAGAHRASCSSTSQTRSLERRATEAGEAYLPGYTHLQRAQPVLLAHQLLAHGWALRPRRRPAGRRAAPPRRLAPRRRGARRLLASARPRLGRGRPRLRLAASRTRSTRCPTATSSPRRSSDLRLVGVHLSRLGEEVVDLSRPRSSASIRLDDAWATGSSMLPQKKNPDVAELARGKAGRLIGHLAGLLATLKGLPLAYNRDLQEDKEPLFDALRPDLAWPRGAGRPARARWRSTSSGCRTRPTRRRSSPPSTSPSGSSRRGVPFREAHGIVGGLVRRSACSGACPLAELVAAAPALGDRGGRAPRAGLCGHAAGRPPVAAAPQRWRCSSSASRAPRRRATASGSPTLARQDARAGARRRAGVLARDPLEVAPQLLASCSSARAVVRAGRIVEVEAYRGADDAA